GAASGNGHGGARRGGRAERARRSARPRRGRARRLRAAVGRADHRDRRWTVRARRLLRGDPRRRRARGRGDGTAGRVQPRLQRARPGRRGGPRLVCLGVVASPEMNERSFSGEGPRIAPPFTAEHDLFRKTLRDYVTRELAPHALEWDEAGIFPREVFKGLAQLGAL